MTKEQPSRGTGRSRTGTEAGRIRIWVKVRQALGFKRRDRVMSPIDAEPESVALRRSPGIAGVYGAVTPGQRPEDFQQLRREFEQGVADEVMSEG